MATDYRRTVDRGMIDQWLSWFTLRRAGNSRLIKTSYFWLVFVPLAAKVLAPIAVNGGIKLPWFGNEAQYVSLVLPFSWVAFFFMALAIAIGQAIYSVWCPDLVKRFADFGSFRLSHRGVSPLVYWSRTLLRRYSGERLRECFQMMVRAARLEDKLAETPHAGTLLRGDDSSASRDRAWSFIVAALHELPKLEEAEPVISDVFDVVTDFVARLARPALVVSTIFFAIGLGLFLFVLGENVVEVIGIATG